MQRRFNSDPAFRATELLLHERVPKTPAVAVRIRRRCRAARSAGVRRSCSRASGCSARRTRRRRKCICCPTGGITWRCRRRAGGIAGGGSLALTRWHEDAVRDAWGAFCYVRDVETGEFWSATYQPTLKRPAKYEALFLQGRAEFRRRDGDIETHMDIAVSPEDDIELRRLTLINHGQTRRTIELTSYAEVVLAARVRTRRIRRSVIYSCRRDCCGSGRRFCARGGRGRRGSGRRGWCT